MIGTGLGGWNAIESRHGQCEKFQSSLRDEVHAAREQPGVGNAGLFSVVPMGRNERE
jgi:hypothetical protein